MQVKAKELGVKDQLADLELIIWGDRVFPAFRFL